MLGRRLIALNARSLRSGAVALPVRRASSALTAPRAVPRRPLSTQAHRPAKAAAKEKPHIADRIAATMKMDAAAPAVDVDMHAKKRTSNIVLGGVLGGFVVFVYWYSARKVAATDEDFDEQEIRAIQKEIDTERELSAARAADLKRDDELRLKLLATTKPPASLNAQLQQQPKP